MAVADLTKAVCTEDWVNKVANTRDVDLRAHRIALTYWAFACALDEWINGENSVWESLEAQRSFSRSNATWFNFATWATATINHDLTLKRPPAGVDRLIPSPLRRTIFPWIVHLKAGDGQRVSRSLTWAQRLVFLSTTLTFIARCAEPATGWDAERTADEIEQAAGWGNNLLGRDRHLKVIWDAFDAYETARDSSLRLEILGGRDAAPDEEVRVLTRRIALSILRANIMITAVEQDVVDEAVADTIDYLPEVTSAGLIRRVATFGDRYLDTPRGVTAMDLAFRWGPSTAIAKSLWARFMTEQILVMEFPSETIRLGKDIPVPSPTSPFFPPELTDLAPPTDQESNLSELVSSFDRTQGDGKGSGAHDWRDYYDRMNWAVNMLRSRQQVPSLYWAPYSEQDQRRIRLGHMPLSSGDPSEYDVLAPLQGFGPGES